MRIALPLLVFAISALTGTSIISAKLFFKEKIMVLAAGTVFGLAITTALTYLTTAFITLQPGLVIFVLTLETFAVYLINKLTKARFKFTDMPLDKTALFLLIALFVLFGLIAPKTLIDNTATNGGLSTGLINAYGDLGFHMSNITSLAYGQTLPPANPILAGNRFTYPFFSNFFSAILLVSGASYDQVVVWPALVLLPLTFILLYFLARELTASKHAALLVILLFLFAGATLGWIRLPADLTAMPNGSIISSLANLPRDYTGHSTNDPDGFHLINPIISLFIPQRSFMFGMPLAFIMLLLLINREPSGRSQAFTLAGVMAGLLPLFHAHTVVALLPLILLLFITAPRKDWYRFFVAAALTGLPGVLYYITSSASSSASPHLQLGWMARDENFFFYWFKNSGLLLPITILGFLLPGPRYLKIFALAGLILFLSANIWLFAAWEWDNTKLFVYWILFTLPLVAHTAIHLFHKRNFFLRSVVVVAIVFQMLSGAIDVLRLTLPGTPTWQDWDNDSIAMAELIRTSTNRQDAILIAPYHNSPAALSGRAVYLGFPAHVWTHGGNYWTREGAIRQFYNGEIEKLPEHHPQYAVVGPVERTLYPQLQIRSDWQLVGQKGPYTLYKL